MWITSHLRESALADARCVALLKGNSDAKTTNQACEAAANAVEFASFDNLEIAA
jgi:hypothetical protein